MRSSKGDVRNIPPESRPPFWAKEHNAHEKQRRAFAALKAARTRLWSLDPEEDPLAWDEALADVKRRQKALGLTQMSLSPEGLDVEEAENDDV